MGVIQDYRDMNDAIKSSVESLQSAEEMTYSVFKMKYGVKENSCYLIGRMGELHIASLSEKQALSMLYPDGKTVDGEEPDLHNEMEVYNASDENENKFESYGAYLRHVVREIHDSYRELMSVNESIRFLISQKNVMAENIMKAQDDPKFKEKRAERIAQLDKDIEAETDSYKKKNLIEFKEFNEKLDDSNYIFDRIRSIPDEADSIVESFFNPTKNRYIMKRASDKFRQLGLGNSAVTLRRFSNLEEMFLDDKYAQFNNLFLFVAFRMVSSTRTEFERTYAKDIIVKLNRLFNHSFSSPEKEEEFLKLITDFEDLFLQNDEYVARFKNENRTWSGCKTNVHEDGVRNRIERIYYKNDIHPCGTDSKFSGSKVYSFALPNHAMVNHFVQGLVGDFKAHSPEANVVVFDPVISSGDITIMGYDRYKEYLDLTLRKDSESFTNDTVIILSDIAYPEMDLDEYKFYMLRNNLLAEKTGWVIINICGYKDDPNYEYEIKAPSLDSIDKIESDAGYYRNRLNIMYSSSYSTTAVNIPVGKNQVDFVILNAKETTLSEPIYHMVEEDGSMKTYPHSILYPDDLGNDTEPAVEEVEEIAEDIGGKVEDAANDALPESTEEGKKIVPLMVMKENGEVEEVPGMFAEITGTVEVPNDEPMTIDTVAKADSEPET